MPASLAVFVQFMNLRSIVLSYSVRYDQDSVLGFALYTIFEKVLEIEPIKFLFWYVWISVGLFCNRSINQLGWSGVDDQYLVCRLCCCMDWPLWQPSQF